MPDGYLGPNTYLPFWIIMIPIWYYAGRWLRTNLRTKQVPYLALAAAFSFVIMMFNVPIPGGSTGHAVGSALVAIILGPWAAVVTTSVALLIQCLLFGDGGITTFGANCFNMAVVIPFVGYYTYAFIAGKTKMTDRRRIIGSAVGAWLGLTLAAVCAGFEMGIQPIINVSSTGVPLYMPYGLDVTVPAMVFGHAFFFSIVEVIITAVAFTYIARNDPTIIWNYKVIEAASQPRVTAAAA